MSHFLHPAHIQLDLRPTSLQRLQAPLAAPHQIRAKVRLSMDSGLPTVPSQVRGHRPDERISGASMSTGNSTGSGLVMARFCAAKPPTYSANPIAAH